jgi:hypothetical protein
MYSKYAYSVNFSGFVAMLLTPRGGVTQRFNLFHSIIDLSVSFGNLSITRYQRDMGDENHEVYNL